MPALEFHHTITYPDGRVFKGEIDRGKDARSLRLKSLKGLRVLDIATNDGFFAFLSEQLGAEEVVALDVGSYLDYDWGPMGPPDTEHLRQQDKWAVFDFHHKNLSSKVIKRQMSVYDIESLGVFDVVLNYGLVYHLRNPQAAIDACRKICKGFCVVETAASFLPKYFPVTVEMGTAVFLGSVTDTFLPTPSALASWMFKAGFGGICLDSVYEGRCTAIGVVDESYLHWFGHLEFCGEDFWRKVNKSMRRYLPDKPVNV